MTVTTAATLWSRRWISTNSSSSARWVRPLSARGGFGTRQLMQPLTAAATSPAQAPLSSVVSSCCWFSSDATATSKPHKWSDNVKRGKKVLQALEQLPSNLRFDTRSTCIPISIVSNDIETTTTGRPAPPLAESSDGDEQDDDDTVIRASETTFPVQRTVDGLVAIPLPQRLHVTVHDVLDRRHPVGTIWLPQHVFGRDPIRVDLIKRAVEYQRNRKRGVRKAVTKTIGQVSGSGKKIRNQKGSGGARAGHRRPPHFRGGARAHGPKGKIQDYGNTKLNAKVRQLAVQHALSQKLKEQNLIVMDQLQQKLTSHQTKVLAKQLKQWKIGGRYGKSALILDVLEEEVEDEVAGGVDEVLEGEDALPTQGDDPTVTMPVESKSNSLASGRRSNPVHIQKGGGLPIKVKVAARNIAHVMTENVWYANVYNILKYEKVILTLAALEALEQRFKSSSY